MTNGNDTIGGMDTLGGWHEGEAAPESWRDADTLSGGRTLGSDGRIVLAGRYAVVKRLGEGGMGSVWLAEDRKLDGRKVAIKMLPAILAGKKTAYRQVKQEALMAMKLSHPNIATVRAFEEDESGSPFLVMDFIDGEGLDEMLAEKGKLSEEETVKLLAPVAAALDYAHAQGVVHRDVKPGNVMVDRNGTPFVLDFGIAREVQETMTRVTGKLSSGTLLYMSPEQLKGRAPKAAQDVYSFAVMAYECLTGAPPFSRGQIEWQIVNKVPEPLPDGVGEALRAGVMAGLAKDPQDRPATCAGVLAAPPINGSSGARERFNAKREEVPEISDEELAEATRRAETGAQRAEAARKKWERAKTRKKTGRVLAALVAVGLLAWGCQSVWLRIQTSWLRMQTSASGSPGTARPTSSDLPGIGSQVKNGDVMAIDLGNGVILEMVYCPGVAEGFWMGKYEVTQEQWQQVMGMNPSHCGDKPKNPVENVSWNMCQEFMKKLNALPAARESNLTFRLPTKEEWESACRAGAPKGADYCKLADGTQITVSTLDRVAWFGEDWNKDSPHPAGQKQPNAWGLYDMHGNVWEWTETADGNDRVNRGGSFCCPAELCTAGFWHGLSPDYVDGVLAFGLLGLRLAASGRAATM